MTGAHPAFRPVAAASTRGAGPDSRGALGARVDRWRDAEPARCPCSGRTLTTCAGAPYCQTCGRIGLDPWRNVRKRS